MRVLKNQLKIKRWLNKQEKRIIIFLFLLSLLIYVYLRFNLNILKINSFFRPLLFFTNSNNFSLLFFESFLPLSLASTNHIHRWIHGRQQHQPAVPPSPSPPIATATNASTASPQRWRRWWSRRTWRINKARFDGGKGKNSQHTNAWNSLEMSKMWLNQHQILLLQQLQSHPTSPLLQSMPPLLDTWRRSKERSCWWWLPQKQKNQKQQRWRWRW